MSQPASHEFKKKNLRFLYGHIPPKKKHQPSVKSHHPSLRKKKKTCFSSNVPTFLTASKNKNMARNKRLFGDVFLSTPKQRGLEAGIPILGEVEFFWWLRFGYLEDHPRTWIRGDRITPIYWRHEVRPFGRGTTTTRSLEDKNDHHGY